MSTPTPEEIAEMERYLRELGAYPTPPASPFHHSSVPASPAHSHTDLTQPQMPEDTICRVCYEPDAQILQCGHHIHRACVVRSGVARCPVCRAEVTLSDEEARQMRQTRQGMSHLPQSFSPHLRPILENIHNLSMSDIAGLAIVIQNEVERRQNDQVREAMLRQISSD